MDAFDKLLEQGGLVQVEPRPGDPQAAFAIGLISNGTASVEFNFNPNPYPVTLLYSAYNGTKNMVNTLINELIHLVNEGNHDEEMAKRVIKGGASNSALPNPSDYDKFGRAKDGSGKNITFERSKIWNTALRNACNPSDEEFKKWWRDGD